MPKDAAFSQVTRCLNCTAAYSQQAEQCAWEAAQDQGRAVPCALAPRQDFDYMGYTALTPQGWRYTLWAHMDNATQRVDFARPTFDELYDLRNDAHADFDLDAYSQNVASENAALCATLKADVVAAVQSWY